MRRVVQQTWSYPLCACLCVPRAVIQFLTAKNTSVFEIHRQLTNVYGSDIMSMDDEEVVARVLRGAM